MTRPTLKESERMKEIRKEIILIAFAPRKKYENINRVKNELIVCCLRDEKPRAYENINEHTQLYVEINNRKI